MKIEFDREEAIVWAVGFFIVFLLYIGASIYLKLAY